MSTGVRIPLGTPISTVASESFRSSEGYRPSPQHKFKANASLERISPLEQGFERGKSPFAQATVKEQQTKIEGLTERVIRLESTLELLMRTAPIRKLSGRSSGES